MATLVLEQTFEKPVSSEELSDAAKRVDKCLEAYGAVEFESCWSADMFAREKPTASY